MHDLALLALPAAITFWALTRAIAPSSQPDADGPSDVDDINNPYLDGAR